MFFVTYPLKLNPEYVSNVFPTPQRYTRINSETSRVCYCVYSVDKELTAQSRRFNDNGEFTANELRNFALDV